ncbi:MAG: zinc ribbon domain-containing protein [Candidatus Thermoplasmatota archaeon]|nr:zinc ribbon domain-containing protein [Candidatus Thermoplasmatota archaeon]
MNLTNNNKMKRTSRIYLKEVNINKVNKLEEFLVTYNRAVNYTIERLWSAQDFSSGFLSKEVTDGTSLKFNITARLSQCIGKQSKEIISSQLEKKDKRMPRFHKTIANLDGRFTRIDGFDGSFDKCVKFGSGVPGVVILFNLNKQINALLNDGWQIGKSIRLGWNKENGLFIDLILEKERHEKRAKGKIIGIDRGVNSMLFTSDGQDLGSEMKAEMLSVDKHRKSYHQYITTEENRYIKKLNLEGVKAIVIEDLKNVTMNKRGRFSRGVNRLLSFWHYARVGIRLEQMCEELGISVYRKDPWKTSQRCPECGNIDRRNRKGIKFLCLRCGHVDNADHAGAKNLEFLGLAGGYSLRSLSSKLNGGSVNECP